MFFSHKNNQFSTQVFFFLHVLRLISISPYARFLLNLLTGPDKHSDHALHLSFRYPEDLVVLNTMEGGHWQSEKRMYNIPVKQGEHFQMLVYVKPHKFKVRGNYTSGAAPMWPMCPRGPGEVKGRGAQPI